MFCPGDIKNLGLRLPFFLSSSPKMAVLLASCFFEDVVVIFMRANPIPHNIATINNSDCSPTKSDTNRIYWVFLAYSFESQTGVRGIRLPNLKTIFGRALYSIRQSMELLLEIFGNVRFHSSSISFSSVLDALNSLSAANPIVSRVF